MSSYFARSTYVSLELFLYITWALGSPGSHEPVWLRRRRMTGSTVEDVVVVFFFSYKDQNGVPDGSMSPIEPHVKFEDSKMCT